jgi:AbrB family looped-hinge helix DNA binding protein
MSETLSTTKMSSRGQVVIPEAIRDQLGLEPGARFVVVGQDDVVMLKLIKPPSMAEYQALKQRLQQQAREAGREPSDVAEAVRRTRGHE